MMVCQPHHIVSALSDESYASRLDTTGESYTARKRRRVTCDRCNTSMQAAYLRIHKRRVHGLDEGQVCIPAPQREGRLYTMEVPRVVRKANCPVPGCPGTASSWFSMRRHFVSRHPVDSVHICQEGPRPFEKCVHCGLQLPRSSHNSKHYNGKSNGTPSTGLRPLISGNLQSMGRYWLRLLRSSISDVRCLE